MTVFVLTPFVVIYRIILNFNLFRKDADGALNIVSLTLIIASSLFFLYSVFDGMFIRSEFLFFLFIAAPWAIGGLLIADLVASLVQVVRAFRSDFGLQFKILRCVSLLLFVAVVGLAFWAAIAPAPI